MQLERIVERRVGIEPPQVEVRFEGLIVEADVVMGARGLPSVGNSIRATADVRCPTARCCTALRANLRTCPLT